MFITGREQNMKPIIGPNLFICFVSCQDVCTSVHLHVNQTVIFFIYLPVRLVVSSSICRFCVHQSVNRHKRLSICQLIHLAVRFPVGRSVGQTGRLKNYPFASALNLCQNLIKIFFCLHSSHLKIYYLTTPFVTEKLVKKFRQRTTLTNLIPTLNQIYLSLIPFGISSQWYQPQSHQSAPWH